MIISSEFEDLVEWHCQVLPQLSLEEEGKRGRMEKFSMFFSWNSTIDS